MNDRRANVVGLGLIGGSVGSALRSRGWHVTGRDVDPRRHTRALQIGAIDEPGTDESAELTVVAVPASAVVEEVRSALAKTTGLVTDVASVKAPVCSVVDDLRFVGGHPMAGSEQEGIDGADPDMFEGAVWVLTPTPATPDHVIGLVAGVVRSLGAEVVALAPERHDEIVAVVSHVPHLVAATLMTMADERAVDHAALLRLAAGGFRDMTRVAAGHPAIWPDICAENRRAIVKVMDALLADLDGMREAVAAGDGTGLFERLERARVARRNLPGLATHPEALVELRIPVADRPGVVAEVFTLAGELGVNVVDFEVYHSAEGSSGVLIIVVDARSTDLLRGGLLARGFRPGVRRLE
jgi:prephenate dehydrogenase